jgi:CheY-like chemotaxis protein
VIETPIPRGKRVLLVDDDPQARKVLKLFLSIDQHTITEAENGREACLKYCPGEFDLVVTDYDMPVMKGDELTRTIKCLVPTQRIIMVTGLPGDLWGQNNPVDTLLIKPITIAELRQAVSTVLSPMFKKVPRSSSPDAMSGTPSS